MPWSSAIPLLAATLVSATALGLLGSACTGSVTGGDDDSSERELCLDTPGPSPIRRLTRAEYNNTIRDLLGDDSAPASGFAADDTAHGFDNNADLMSVAPDLADAYMTAAESIARRATNSGHLPSLTGCTEGDDICARRFVERLGPKAYRRPLELDEVESLMATFAAGRSGRDFATGIEAVLERILQSPFFLYRVEAGEPLADDPTIAKLSSFEMATRLSYFFWGSMPDDALFETAAADGLDSADAIEREARRLLADPRAADSVARFHEQWLLIADDGEGKDQAIFPEFNPDVLAAMREETRRFVTHVVLAESGDLSTLLTAPLSFMNKPLADFYGVSGPTGDDFVAVELDPAQRAGILTQGSVMTLQSHANQTSPILRGKFVREQLLCGVLSTPPPDAVIATPEPAAGQTTRERFSAHSADPACSGCHTYMDPLGFALEHFDAVGRFRADENGDAIDASGSAAGSDISEPFDGAVELATSLAGSADVEQCVVTQWFRYAAGRDVSDEDACTIDDLGASFTASGGNISELMIALARSSTFRYRHVAPASAGEAGQP